MSGVQGRVLNSNASSNNGINNNGNNTANSKSNNENDSPREDSDFNGNEYSISNIRLLDDETQKGLLFKALRGKS